MALRVLTGIMVPTQRQGNATIRFNPHTVTGDASPAELNEWGDKGDFEQPPGKIVSLRQLVFIEFAGISEVEVFRIDDEAPTTAEMVVRWNSAPFARIQEISYMIIGEA